MGKRLAGQREGALQAIEASPALQHLGQAFTARARVLIRPGALKDLLSGTWLGHPAHPMLTDLPIGAWISAAVLDVGELLGCRSGSASDTLIAVGMLSALPTALSGLSDLSDEYGGDILGMGAAHALGNTSALVLYGASWLARRKGRRKAGITLSLLGTGVMASSGYLGGHLAFRRGLGVNRTALDQPIAEWTRAMDDSALAEGANQMVVVEGREVLLHRSGGRVVAMVNRCSHRGGPLNEGTFEGDTVTCPWHGGKFCLTDGQVLGGPPSSPQELFETRVWEGAIEVRTAPLHTEQLGME